MKYLREFETVADYNAAKDGLITPNVSLITETNGVAYKPYVPPTPIETRVVAKFNVTDTSNPTIIISQFAYSPFSEIEIDGVVQPSVVSAYTFSTTGEHTVKYTLAIPTSIGDSAFSDCSSLTSIDIPNSVTSIGTNAFFSCNYLSSVTIPNSVTSIGGYAFSNCSSLSSMTIGSGVTSIGDFAFNGCSNLTSVTIPNSVTSISDSAFYFCYSLSSVTIPNSVTSIGNEAFSYCSSLSSVTIPNSVTSIGNEAFRGTPWWDSYSADTSNQYGNIIYINDIAYIATSQSITSCTFKSSTISISNNSFFCCYSLSSVTIPNSVTSIGDNAFSYCSGLTSCTIGSSVTSIGYSAFLEVYIQKDNFINNSQLDAAANNYWGAIIYDEKINGMYISETTVIKADRNITEANIPNTVTSIGDYAFYYCSSLSSVTIPNSVTSIGTNAFFYCDSLSSVTIPNSVTSIGDSAFSYCSGLTSITIPNSVTSIDDSAFRYCSSLTSVTCNAIVPPTLNELSAAFDDTNNCPIYVPSGSVNSYKAASGWSDYASRIQAIH